MLILKNSELLFHFFYIRYIFNNVRTYLFNIIDYKLIIQTNIILTVNNNNNSFSHMFKLNLTSLIIE